MAPAPLLRVVVGRKIDVAVRAPPRALGMAHPHIYALIGHRQLNPLDRPRCHHTQQMPVELDVPHAPSLSRRRAGGYRGPQSPTGKPGEPTITTRQRSRSTPRTATAPPPAPSASSHLQPRPAPRAHRPGASRPDLPTRTHTHAEPHTQAARAIPIDLPQPSILMRDIKTATCGK